MNPLMRHGHLLADSFNPNANGETTDILGMLAWCASAAGVGGLIIVGMQMAVQLRRGEPGEGGVHFRGVFFVTLASLLATCAGPLVAALGDLSLH
ncbi:hypothetical protein [Streptomyces shenzhenensis]|uniref:hypothetical protein n=1 Tax=Streptomyces shenzhenensis TaxID=943815 RepID=UPI00367479F6